MKNINPVLSRLGRALLALLLTTSGVAAQPAAPPRDLVLVGGTLIDGTGAAPVSDSVIVVENGRFKAVGKRGQVPIPANANVINVSGRTVLPGLIDIHVHTKEWFYPMLLHYGITTVADFDNDNGWIFAQKRALADGRIKGPRMLVSGTYIWGPLLPEVQGTFDAAPVRTVEETRAYMHWLESQGVDILKTDEGLSDAQLKAVVDEAKRAGLPTMGHTQNIRRAASLGFQYDEHMDTMARSLLDPDEKMDPKTYPPRGGPVKPPKVAPESQINPKDFPPLIKYLVAHGVLVNPTLISSWSDGTERRRQLAAETAKLAKDPAMAFVAADSRKSWAEPASKVQRAGYANVAEFLKEYSAAGGKVVVGTDASGRQDTIPGLGFSYEAQMINDAGVPAMKVIQGATLWNAQMLKRDKDLGSVEVGKIADLTVIDGNPLADIGTLKNVRLVVMNGAVVDTRYDPKWKNPIPEPYWPYPPVSVTAVTPKLAHQGDPSVTLTVEGAKFVPNSKVCFDGVALPTHFVSDTKLTATLDKSLFSRPPGSYVVYVLNPGAGGTVSTTGYFTIDFKK